MKIITKNIVKILLMTTLVVVTQFAFVGCSRITVIRTREMHAVRDSLNLELAARFDSLTAEQNKLLEEQKNIAEMLRLLRADQLLRFDMIDRKVTIIESNVSESHARISRLDRQTAEVNRRIEQRFASEEEAANQRVMQIEKLFEVAMSDFNAGRLDLAIGGFDDVVRQFGESPFAAEAAFWIAESHFAKRSFDVAERHYFEFIRDHPTSEKNCAALYKLGLVYDHQEKARSRDMVWNNLLERCPNNVEADAVRSIRGE